MTYKCDVCSKYYVKSRWKQEHKVEAVPAWGVLNAAKQKSSTIINGSGKSKNPKIDALVNEIIKDGGAETSSSTTQHSEKVLPRAVFPSTRKW